MAQRHEGEVCVITGTGGSMGRASALAFAREGALVVGCDFASGESSYVTGVDCVVGGGTKVW